MKDDDRRDACCTEACACGVSRTIANDSGASIDMHQLAVGTGAQVEGEFKIPGLGQSEAAHLRLQTQSHSAKPTLVRQESVMITQARSPRNLAHLPSTELHLLSQARRPKAPPDAPPFVLLVDPILMERVNLKDIYGPFLPPGWPPETPLPIRTLLPPIVPEEPEPPVEPEPPIVPVVPPTPPTSDPPYDNGLEDWENWNEPGNLPPVPGSAEDMAQKEFEYKLSLARKRLKEVEETNPPPKDPADETPERKAELGNKIQETLEAEEYSPDVIDQVMREAGYR